MAYTVVLDPSEVAINRTQLDLNSGPIRVDQAGIDWGDAAIQAYQSDMLVGSSTVGYRLPNRQVTLPLFVFDAEGGATAFKTARNQLAQKCALIQREGGWLKRGTGRYADVINATLTFPDKWGETGYLEEGVKLTLECLPDFYSDEVILGSLTGTGDVVNQLIDPSGMNFVPNPSFEGITTGWTTSNCAVTASTSQAFSGTYSARLSSSGAGTMNINNDPATSTGVVAGNIYTASAYFRANSSTRSCYINLVFRDVSSVQVGSTFTSVTVTNSSSGWVRASVSATAPANAVKAGMYCYVQSTAGAGEIHFVDGTMITQSSTPATYFDGSTAGYVWTGPANNSASAPIEYIQGDHPGRMRILVTDTSANAQHGIIYGLRCRQFSSSSTGLLAYEAEALAASSGTASGALTGAYSGNAMTYTGVGAAWTDILQLQLTAGNALTHVGSYCVWARVYASTNTSQVRLQWTVGNTAPYEQNDSMAIPSATTFYLLKLGTVRLDRMPVGTHSWYGKIQGYAGSTTNLSIDRVWLQPLDEAGGYATVPYSSGYADAVVVSNGSSEIRHDGIYRQSGTNWGPVHYVIGDLPRVPPSGIENQPVDIMIKPSRGDLATQADNGMDTFTVQVRYRPSYLFGHEA